MALRVVGTIKVLIVQQPCLVLTDMRHTYLHSVQFWIQIFHIEISYDKDAMKHKWNKKKFRNKMRISHVIFAFYCFPTMEQKHAIANTELWSHWHNTQWFKLIYRSFGQKSMHCTFYMYCGIRPKINSFPFFHFTGIQNSRFFSSFKLQC